MYIITITIILFYARRTGDHPGTLLSAGSLTWTTAAVPGQLPIFFWSFFSFSQKLTDTISYKIRMYIGLKKNKNFRLIVKYKFILVKEFTKNNSKFFFYIIRINL